VYIVCIIVLPPRWLVITTKVHNPSKLAKLPTILFRYKGREQQLLQDLSEKYLSTAVQGGLSADGGGEVSRVNTGGCMEGWSGDDCDECATGWGGEDCDVLEVVAPSHRAFGCAEGWTGLNCDECAANWGGQDCDIFCDPSKTKDCYEQKGSDSPPPTPPSAGEDSNPKSLIDCASCVAGGFGWSVRKHRCGGFANQHCGPAEM
jgi:hypothetical protein